MLVNTACYHRFEMICMNQQKDNACTQNLHRVFICLPMDIIRSVFPETSHFQGLDGENGQPFLKEKTEQRKNV